MRSYVVMFFALAFSACGIRGNSALMSSSDQVTRGSYALASNLQILSSTQNGDSTTLTVEFDLPCHSTVIGGISLPQVIGSLFNPASDLSILVGVVLEDNIFNPCMGTTKQQTVLVTNTHPVEGKFLGFKILNPQQLASNLSAKIVSESNELAQLDFVFDKPCWANEIVGTFSIPKLGDSPVNPSDAFSEVIGVVVDGNPALTCTGFVSSSFTSVFNTASVEGRFTGFELASLKK